jgi:hypothetical protein
MKMKLDVLSNEQGELLKKMTMEFGTIIEVNDPPVIEPLTTWKNGTFEAPEGVHGFDPVTVIVPPSTIMPKEITENGVYDAAGDAVDGYNPVTVNVPPPQGWQPHPDWWDIEQIFKNDPDPNKKTIILYNDSRRKQMISVFSANSYVKTSDGKTYNSSDFIEDDEMFYLNIELDLTKDKPCSIGYATRYAIIYDASPNYFLTCVENELYVYATDNGFNGGMFSNSLINSVKFENLITTTRSITINNCPNLENVTNLERISFSSATTLTSNALKHINLINPNISNSPMLTSVTALPSSNNISGNLGINVQVLDCFEGFTPTGINLIGSRLLSISAFIRFGNKLGTTPTARTITLHNNFKSQLTSEEIAIFTNKNYTIA